MKKIYFLLLPAFLLLHTVSNAQVPNPGFENLNADGSVSNWGNVYLFSVWIDSTGVSHGDSIVFDNYFYFSTTDAHTGSRALEMRNAFNFTTNQGTAGGVAADISPVFSGWSSFQFLPVAIRPTDLSFYYKYFPVNTDSAFASVLVFDTMGYQIGEASIIIGGTVSSYTYATIPITYTTTDVPAFVVLNFRTATNGGSISLGTRFVVDDVSLNNATGINEVSNPKMISFYPNPAQHSFSVSTKEKITGVSAYDVSGKETSFSFYSARNIDCSSLAAGVYMVCVKTEEHRYYEKLVIEK